MREREDLRGLERALGETEKVSEAVVWSTVIQEGLRGSCESFKVR